MAFSVVKDLLIGLLLISVRTPRGAAWRRICLGGGVPALLLDRLVVAHRAAGGRAEHAVMAGQVAGNTANRGPGHTASGAGCLRQHRKTAGCEDSKNEKYFHG